MDTSVPSLKSNTTAMAICCFLRPRTVIPASGIPPMESDWVPTKAIKVSYGPSMSIGRRNTSCRAPVTKRWWFGTSKRANRWHSVDQCTQSYGHALGSIGRNISKAHFRSRQRRPGHLGPANWKEKDAGIGTRQTDQRHADVPRQRRSAHWKSWIRVSIRFKIRWYEPTGLKHPLEC